MSAAVQAEAFFPLDRVPLVTLARAKKRGLSMDSAHSVGGAWTNPGSLKLVIA